MIKAATAIAKATASVDAFSASYRALSNYKNVKTYNVVGPTPRMPKQERNKPCGCGSGTKAKKCCGDYPKKENP